MLRRMEKEEEAVESEEATRSSEQKNRQGYLGQVAVGNFSKKS